MHEIFLLPLWLLLKNFILFTPFTLFQSEQIDPIKQAINQSPTNRPPTQVSQSVSEREREICVDKLQSGLSFDSTGGGVAQSKYFIIGAGSVEQNSRIHLVAPSVVVERPRT